MRKPQPTFQWDDSNRQQPVSREYAAHLLRCYRKDAKQPPTEQRYKLSRLDRNVYSVRNNYAGSPIGVIRTKHH